MCISCEMEDKWPPFIEFVIWFVLQGLSVGNHFGVWAVIQTNILDLDYTNMSHPNATLPPITTTPLIPTTVSNFALDFMNGTTNGTIFPANETVVPYPWEKLEDFRTALLALCILGAILFVVHAGLLIPNIVQSFRTGDPLMLKETGGVYFENLLKMHVVLLVLETLLVDIPAGCVTMEILSLIWEGPLSESDNMKASKLILLLSLIGLAFIAMYKGMMPLFLWIGNPFCFPCIPLRLLVVFPGGLIALVMTFGPAMGVAKHRLLQFAPAVLQAEIGELANTFFSIGVIFWGVFLVVAICSGFLWYKVCREGADGDICSVCC